MQEWIRKVKINNRTEIAQLLITQKVVANICNELFEKSFNLGIKKEIIRADQKITLKMIFCRLNHMFRSYKNVSCTQKKLIDHYNKGYKCSDESRSKDNPI